MILGHGIGLPAMSRHRDQWAASVREPAEGTPQLVALSAQVAALREALTPSLETKAAYVARFEQQCPDDETVPWSTIKEIMAAILSRAGMSGGVK